MSPITLSELASIQSAAASILDLSCEVWRKVRTPDGYGGFTESWGLVETTTCGMSQPTASHLQNYDFLLASLSAWALKFPVGTDVRHQDHLVISGQTLEASYALRAFGAPVDIGDYQTLVAQVVLAPRSYAALLVVLASEIK